jgi:hypothetical protein
VIGEPVVGIERIIAKVVEDRRVETVRAGSDGSGSRLRGYLSEVGIGPLFSGGLPLTFARCLHGINHVTR